MSARTSGTGLGLAIALGIARSHDISLGDSKAGGLRATVRVPR